MRKALVATAIGALLVASEAAASDNATLNIGDRLGSVTSASDNLEGLGCRENDNNREGCGGEAILIAVWAALFIGLVAWGFSQGGNGTPGTP